LTGFRDDRGVACAREEKGSSKVFRWRLRDDRRHRRVER
jgi:hypothetical protein